MTRRCLHVYPDVSRPTPRRCLQARGACLRLLRVERLSHLEQLVDALVLCTQPVHLLHVTRESFGVERNRLDILRELDLHLHCMARQGEARLPTPPGSSQHDVRTARRGAAAQSTCIARLPKSAVLADSDTSSADGDKQTIMFVRQLPPSDCCSRNVSFESRYGTWNAPERADDVASADMTVPSISSDLLMCCTAVQ